MVLVIVGVIVGVLVIVGVTDDVLVIVGVTGGEPGQAFPPEQSPKFCISTFESTTVGAEPQV